MIASIGLTISAYVVVRMLELFASEPPKPVYINVLAGITVVVAILNALNCIFAGGEFPQ